MTRRCHFSVSLVGSSAIRAPSTPLQINGPDERSSFAVERQVRGPRRGAVEVSRIDKSIASPKTAALHAALADGLAFDRKDNDEIAVGVRPDLLLAYINNAAMLHQLGSDGKTFKPLAKAIVLEPVPEADLSKLSVERRRIVETVSRLARSANFRDQVLTAYGHRCAVTRMQLKLVEAAHILPVVAEKSPDHVSNGLALSSTYHRAFDTGLIYLNEGFEMCISALRRKQLVDLGLDGGLPEFEKTLGRIHLPPDKAQWPNRALVQRANKLRMVG